MKRQSVALYNLLSEDARSLSTGDRYCISEELGSTGLFVCTPTSAGLSSICLHATHELADSGRRTDASKP